MRREIQIAGIIQAALITGCILCADALGADESIHFTRATYDILLRWVNFGILAALVFKYARRPIISFLKDKRVEVSRSIQKLEDEKHRVETRIGEARIQLAAGQERLALIKEKIIAEGQRRKEQMIADARQESALLLKATKHKIDARIRESSERIRTELIDMAADVADGELSRLLTKDDQERLIRDWMEAAKSQEGV